MDLGLRLSSKNDYRKKRILNSKAPVMPELATLSVSSSHGWALAAIPEQWKNKPHNSSTADFLKLFIFMQDACWTHKTFENFRLQFYLLWCLLVRNFWRLSEFIYVQSLKNKF